jgi:ribonuclease HI
VDDHFWTTTAFPHPRDRWPLPAAQEAMTANYTAYDDGNDTPGFGACTGSLFIDGSCEPSGIRGLARAAACVAEIDGDGNLMRELLIPVPPTLQQTPQAAEFVAYFMAITQLTAPTTIYTDCKGVQMAADLDIAKAADPRRRYGDILISAGADPEVKRRCTSVKWIRAHRLLSRPRMRMTNGE